MNNYNSSAVACKDFYGILVSRGMLEYGKVIPINDIYTILNITVPETGTRDEFKQLELYELTLTDYVRRTLLKQGKYLEKSGQSYRVLLPSENGKKIENFMASATRKLRRAKVLLRSTPPEHRPTNNNALAVNIAAKEGKIKEAQERANI